MNSKRHTKLIIGAFLLLLVLSIFFLWKHSKAIYQKPQKTLSAPIYKTMSEYSDQNATYSCSQDIEVKLTYGQIPGPQGMTSIPIYQPVNIESVLSPNYTVLEQFFLIFIPDTSGNYKIDSVGGSSYK